MTPRIWLSPIVAAGGLAVAVAVAPAAAPVAKVATVRCAVAAATAVPSGQTAVNPAAPRGVQYGHAACGRPFGQGVQENRFTVMPTGDLQGKYKLYFAGGTVHGRFDLAPGEGQPPSPTTFNNASYDGRITVLGGTAQYRQAKGTGTMRCSSTDGVHFKCTERLRLKSS